MKPGRQSQAGDVFNDVYPEDINRVKRLGMPRSRIVARIEEAAEGKRDRAPSTA